MPIIPILRCDVKCKMVIFWLSGNCQSTDSSSATATCLVSSNQSASWTVSVPGQVESSKLESSLVAKTNVQASQPLGWPHCLENMCSSFQVKMERIEEERQGEGEARRLQQDEKEKTEKVWRKEKGRLRSRCMLLGAICTGVGFY